MLRSISLFLSFLVLSISLAQADDIPVDVPKELPPIKASPQASPELKKAIEQKDFVKANAELKPKPENGHFKSLAPLAGYNPTYGFFGGAGYFRKVVENEEEKSQWGLVAVISQFKQAVKTEFKGEAKLSPFWRVEWRNELANGYESNFGEGNDTRAEDRVDVPLWKDELDLYFPYYSSEHFAVGPGFEHRIRHNDRFYNQGDEARMKDRYPDQEATAALVFLERVDFRDIAANPSLGWSQELRVNFVKPYLGPQRDPFTMVDLSLSMFQYLLNRDLVMAYTIAGGWIFGTPTYLNQFRLGGTDRLRGYYYNRFRGTKYYVEQTELRFPVLGLVSGAAFVEFGEVTQLHKPLARAHVSYGGGLRIGLPPDKVSKIRIDYAIGRDQRGFFVDFGHAF